MPKAQWSEGRPVTPCTRGHPQTVPPRERVGRLQGAFTPPRSAVARCTRCSGGRRPGSGSGTPGRPWSWAPPPAFAWSGGRPVRLRAPVPGRHAYPQRRPHIRAAVRRRSLDRAPGHRGDPGPATPPGRIGAGGHAGGGPRDAGQRQYRLSRTTCGGYSRSRSSGSTPRSGRRPSPLYGASTIPTPAPRAPRLHRGDSPDGGHLDRRPADGWPGHGRDWERGTIRELLLAPIAGWAVVAGKVMARLASGLLSAMVVLGVLLLIGVRPG